MRRIASLTFSAALALSLGGCATTGKPQKILQQNLMDYASTIRWGGFDGALAFIDPDYLKAHPVTALDMERYHQIRVSYYHDQPAVMAGEREAHQIVEIGIVNEHSQAERAVVDRQIWRWDEKAKRWWLTTGLPDITRH